jgi:uncharacterized protein involved in exopolysaccharide biosynthesis
MTIIGLLRLLRKHMILLLFTPILLAGLVIYFTKNPSFTYSSETTLYTGLASGSSVEMGKSISYFATNTDFDNLINVIQSRQTQEEVSIRLLALHLMLPEPDPRYISQKSFNYLRKITPSYVNSIVLKSKDQINSNKLNNPTALPDSVSHIKKSQKTLYLQHAVKDSETLYSISRQYGMNIKQLKELNGIPENRIKTGQILKVFKHIDGINSTLNDSTFDINHPDTAFSFSNLYASSKETRMFPASVDESAYEQTVKNLTDLYNSNDTNFVSHLINFIDPHYSIEAISSINVQRIGSSDLVKLKYTSDDPGICQQTLVFLTNVCLKNYKVLKENRSDAVVKYFEYQVNQATQKLNAGEDKLLAFNKDNNIINYYEQSKAVAGAKEDLDVDYNNMKIKLAGTEAAIKRLEEKLASQQKIQLKSAPIIEKRNQLSQINTKIATAETIGYANPTNSKELPILKAQAEKLKDEIRESVGELYQLGNSTEGLPISALLTDWIANVLSYEELNAGLGVLSKRIKDFQKQYEIFAPAGANLKRIEREISVSEAEFLELLHGLNLAKLKMQDLELSSNLKPIDQPFLPLTPNPTKRKFLIIGAAMFGFLIVFSTIMALEFFDETLRNPTKASKDLNLLPLGVLPKIYLKSEILNFPFVTHRLIEIMVQRIELMKNEKGGINQPFQILLFSTTNFEGKSVIGRNIASQLRNRGNKVIIIRDSNDNDQNQKSSQDHSPGLLVTPDEPIIRNNRFSILNWILGYSDSRIDFQSPYLYGQNSGLPEEVFYKYPIDDVYHPITDYKELLSKNNHSLAFTPDYVLIEIPSILYYPYPTALLATSDLPLLICRSNRVWSTADQGALENLSKITSRPPIFVLNGVEMEVIESILGELPKKRSVFRRIIKKVFQFQFKSKNQI